MPSSRRAQVLGLIWYRAEIFELIRSMMTDADAIPQDFAQWLLIATRQEERASAQGIRVIRVHIEAYEFIEFCHSKGLPFDSVRRGQYAASKALQAIKQAPGGTA